jgi:ATP-dependent DNA helicase RecG
MTTNEVYNLFATRDDSKLEWKPDVPEDAEVAQLVCGFLNSKGGRIIIGAGRLRVDGVRDAEYKALKLKASLLNAITPHALWTVDVHNVDKGKILVIEVPEGQDKPYVANGGIYQRVHNTTAAATRSQICDLIQNRAFASQRWERQLVVGAEMTDLDNDLIVETTKSALKLGYLKISPEDTDPYHYFLESHGLIYNGGVTNAALVLFGKNPTKFLPQARVRVLVLPEGKTSDVFKMDKIFDSCLLHSIRQVEEVVHLHGGLKSKFTPGNWAREDSLRYPPLALREGVLNALLHRDYDLPGEITIFITPDTVNIANPGGLPLNMTPADLKRTHLSIPRNPDMMHVCFMRGMIEKIGRGTQKIIENCHKAGLREPRWHSNKLQTSLMFFSSPLPDNKSRQLDLNERQNYVLVQIKKAGQLAIKDIDLRAPQEVTARTLRNDLQALASLGLVAQRGRGRNTIYTYTDPSKSQK